MIADAMMAQYEYDQAMSDEMISFVERNAAKALSKDRHAEAKASA
jgi:hypothetical protein